MFKSIEIHNFRAFRHLSIDGLNRLNLFLGASNVGKTCLLEALFVHAGAHNPELPSRLNTFRGISTFPPDAQEIWGWLFYRKHPDQPARITSIDFEMKSRAVAIELMAEETRVKPNDIPKDEDATALPDSASSSSPYRKLSIRLTDNGQHLESSASLHSDGRIQYTTPRLISYPHTIYLATRHRSEIQIAQRFSQVEEVGRQEEVVEVLKTIEPRLRRLAVATIGNESTLRADLDIGRLIPIAFLGEGFVRLAAIILAVLTARDGSVLVDEIENGFHYSVQAKVWSALRDACRRANVQLFATTHSRECALAAHQAMSDSLGFDYEFSAYRLERHGDDINAVHIPKETFETAEELGWEVR
jgi:hypothetical protein